MPAASPCRSSCATARTDFAKLQSITNTDRRQCAIAERAAARLDVVPRHRAANPRRGRSRQGADLARSGRSGVLDARDLFRLDLCLAVQQVRPRVSGLRAGRCEIPAAAARHRKSLGAQSAGRHDPARHHGQDRADRRGAFDQPVQSLSVVERDRAAGGRLQLRRGDRSDGAECGGDPAARRRHRMDRDVLSGEDRRQSDVFRVRDGDAAGLSGARRPIRKLVRAAGGHPVGAAGADRAGAGARNAAHRQQSLHPDRHHSADRAIGQERHSDRRSRARTPRARRQADPRSGGGRRARPLPADPDDVVCVHSRRRAAGDRERRRRQRPQVDRHHRVQRHDRLDLPCRAVRAVAVRGDPAVRGVARLAQGAADCSPRNRPRRHGHDAACERATVTIWTQDALW